MLMVKNRKKQISLSNCVIVGRFNWVSWVEYAYDKVLGAKETLSVRFNRKATNIEDFGYQRLEFEKFVQEYYEVKSGRNQVIVMWQESGAIVAVF